MQGSKIEEQEDERINFENEIKIFTKDNLIKSYEMLDVNPVGAKIKFKTLEDYDFIVTIQVGKGITIEEASVNLDEKRFDSFEQILAKYSHAYNQAFNAGLNNRLNDYLQHQKAENS